MFGDLKRKPLNKIRYTHHVRCCGEVRVHQTLNGEPFYWTILVVAQAVIVRREQVTGQGVVRHLHLQLLIYHTVPRRQIAMQQSFLMQELHGMHYL